MKKKFLVLLLALFVLPCAFILTACGTPIRYLSVVPSDRSFDSTMTHAARDPSRNYDWECSARVVRKNANVAGQNREVIYVDYTWDDKIDDRVTHYVLVYVASKAFYLQDNAWHADSAGRWNTAYTIGYVSFMTRDINGRNFYDKYKTDETENYIEYNFKRDNETFKISNDGYHVLLGYNIEYKTYRKTHTATLTFGESAFTIPHLDTITAEMLAD